jgi:hypothetical protein
LQLPACSLELGFRRRGHGRSLYAASTFSSPTNGDSSSSSNGTKVETEQDPRSEPPSKGGVLQKQLAASRRRRANKGSPASLPPRLGARREGSMNLPLARRETLRRLDL